MTNLFSIGLLWRPTHWLAPVIAGLALFLAPAAEAANPVLTIQGTGGTGSDVTAFVDKVEIIRASDGAVVSGAVGNLSYESHGVLSNGIFGYSPSAAPWDFSFAGIAENGSAFGAPTAPDGIAVAFVQSSMGNNGQLQQTLTLPDGLYKVRFQVAQRDYDTRDQALNVLINGILVGNIQPANTTSFYTFTSNAFGVGTAPVTWTGAVNTDWTTASNWSPAVVPTNTIDVIIPSGPANQPVVSGTQDAQNVLVQSGASLTLAFLRPPRPLPPTSTSTTSTSTTLLTLGNGGRGSLTLASGSTLTQEAASELYITGDMTNNGATFALDATSEIGFGITPTTSHILDGTAGVTFQTLTVGEQGSNDYLSMQVPVQVRRKLGVYNSSTTSLGTGGSLTLLSDATGTALVENSNNSTVTGTVTVQRYIDPTINAGLGYRHYSSPVSNTTVADLATAGFTPTLTTSYNTSATPGTTPLFPNVFGYDQSRVTLANNYAPFNRGFVVPAATTTPLAVGLGYAVNIGSAELVDFTGTLNNGDQPPLALSRLGENTDAGWQLLGNPYPAPLDYSTVVDGVDRTNLNAAIYVFSSTGPYAGSYRSYANGVGGNSVLPVAQGFFVRVNSTSTSGSITFRNAQRLTTPDATTFQRAATDLRPLVQLDLRGSTGKADALYAYVQAGATPAFDSQFDAEKLPNPSGLNLSSTATSGQRLAIDGRPAFDAATVLPLAVGVPAAGTYTFAATTLTNLPAGLDAYLRDAQTGQTVNLRTQPSYSFTVTTAQATALLVGRFSLRFTASVLATAPALTAAQVELFPNPAHARFAVLMPGVPGAAIVQAELVNALGQVVRRQAAALPASGATLTVETGELAAGVYTLRLRAGPTTLAKRVVIQ